MTAASPGTLTDAKLEQKGRVFQMDRDVEEIDLAIHSLYDAALEPHRWPQALQSLSDLVDSRYAALFDTNFANGVVHRQHLHNITAEDQKLYLEHYASIDPRMKFLAIRQPQWFSDYEAFDATFRASHPFYLEYFQPRGAGESLCCLFAVEGPRIGTLVLVRKLGSPKASGDIRRQLDRLVAHLDRAIRITRRFASLATEIVVARSVLDTLDEPLCCIDDSGLIRRTNEAFRKKLQDKQVVSDKNGKLQFSSSRVNVEVMRAVRECCSIANAVYGQDSDAKLTFSVRKKDGTTAFVTVAPLVAGSAHSWAGGPCALLRIDEFNAHPSPERLGQALGLTAAEARLVSTLCQGGPLASAAKENGVTLNTAKTHLAAVFGKTGTKRQSELIALVSALPR
jgi:DNA-binding CsgD family transcriptional regulator